MIKQRDGHITIIDFGNSVEFKGLINVQIGTEGFHAPETVKHVKEEFMRLR